MVTIIEVREMTDEQIMTEMKKIAANRIGTVKETEEMTMYFVVMAQRKGIDPKPKVKAAGYGLYDKAEKEGWF